MKIALAQLNYHVGNFESNTDKIIRAIAEAKNQQAQLIIFSELSVCGYPPHDLLEFKDFIDASNRAVEKIREATDDIAVIIGAPTINPNPRGKKLYNSAYFIKNKKIEQIVHKTLLPTYDIFDEYRYFEPNKEFKIIEFMEQRIALTICEDLWDEQPVNNPFARGTLYETAPMDELIKQRPDIIINVAASPFAHNRQEAKRSIFTGKAKKHQLPVFYVNQVGAHTELTFDGASLAVNSKGDIVSQLNLFKEDLAVFDTTEIEKQPPLQELKNYYIAEIHDALIMGIRDYFQKMGFKKATLGLSGGIDSAVTLAIAEKALGAENIRVLLMPSKYSSDHSIEDAVQLAKNLNIHYEIVNIQPMVDSFDKSLVSIFDNLPMDITEENIQARVRGTLLMAISNKFGHILLNTSNKSEAAVGYGTLYGDMNGGLSVLGDVYKSDVFALAKYINRDKEIIPKNTIVKPPSAELRPDQKDTDSLPEYELLDDILFKYIEQQLSASEIIEQIGHADVVKRVLKLVNTNEYKRYQTPPIIRVSTKAFGPGRKMPLVARY